MKKLTALLAAVMMLFVSAAAAEDLSRPEGDADLLDRVTGFFRQWAENRLDGMVAYCSADWKETVEDPRIALFTLLANRTPRTLETISISGGPEDPVRTVTVHSIIDRNNGLAPIEYRLNILMKLEADGLWYIDPRCLMTAEEVEEIPEPEATEAPGGTGDSTVLYYVPQGGEYYHADPNCPRVNEKFLPMEGQFLYSQVNDSPYSDLRPCMICGAPIRQK